VRGGTSFPQRGQPCSTNPLSLRSTENRLNVDDGAKPLEITTTEWSLPTPLTAVDLLANASSNDCQRPTSILAAG
jgi:hypothetical protein